MEVLGDRYVVTPGLIKGEQYSFLIESKTTLFVQSPEFEPSEPERGVPTFFLALSVAAIVAIILNQQGAIFILPLMVVAIGAFWSLVKSYFKRKRPAGMWRLFLASTEPVLIYSSHDVEAFEAKRNEIEQTLLGRFLNEEE